MEEHKLGESKSEKYQREWINENGTSASITETIDKRIAGVKKTIDKRIAGLKKTLEIIDIAENINLKGRKNKKSAINYFETQIVTAHLHNCESWIGLTQEQITALKDLQNIIL